ncbi:MAG: glycine cleavage system protein H [Betaproteobacteria bacterium]|nr:glycine cleavage system protein H [Betaproteobacteria bacterium]
MIVLRGCAFPEDRYYHADYNVWVQPTAADVVTLGVTSYGAVLAIEFFAFTPKSIGTVIEAGRAVGILELSKTAMSVRSPVAGTLKAVNSAAVAQPSIIGSDPYGAGWLVRLTTNVDLARQTQLLQGEALIVPFEAKMALENFAGAQSG